MLQAERLTCQLQLYSILHVVAVGLPSIINRNQGFGVSTFLRFIDFLLTFRAFAFLLKWGGFVFTSYDLIMDDTLIQNSFVFSFIHPIYSFLSSTPTIRVCLCFLMMYLKLFFFFFLYKLWFKLSELIIQHF